MDLKKFKECVESCYQSLLGQIFDVKCKQKGSSAVTTGGPRDVLVIDDQTTAIIRRIKIQVSVLESEYNRKIGCSEDRECVWKGITHNDYHDSWYLWVEGNSSLDCDSTYRVQVTGVKVLTDLNWVRENYVALANITVEVIEDK